MDIVSQSLLIACVVVFVIGVAVEVIRGTKS
jgi:hypothetical protein